MTREEKLEEALQRIAHWGDAYPIDLFPEPSEEDCKDAHRALMTIGMSLDRFSAAAMRHVIKGVARIAKEALG